MVVLEGGSHEFLNDFESNRNHLLLRNLDLFRLCYHPELYQDQRCTARDYLLCDFDPVYFAYTQTEVRSGL
jgi:hypothetical protein